MLMICAVSNNFVQPGQRIQFKNGYIMVYDPGYQGPKKDAWMGFVPEHKLVIEKTLGRQLNHGEVVHHINMDRSDNRPENLVVLSYYEDRRIHEAIGIFMRSREPGPAPHTLEEQRALVERLRQEAIAAQRKDARNQAVRQARKEHPEWSLEEIGQGFGISRQRVHQIISGDGDEEGNKAASG